jgi:hypothetical protein
LKHDERILIGQVLKIEDCNCATMSEKIVEKAKLHQDVEFLNKVKDECNQLISIFVKSVLTAERNRFQ